MVFNHNNDQINGYRGDIEVLFFLINLTKGVIMTVTNQE